MPKGGKTRWVHDDCETSLVLPLDIKRAEGILAIHAQCDPPCPRKITACKYLDQQRATELRLVRRR